MEEIDGERPPTCRVSVGRRLPLLLRVSSTRGEEHAEGGDMVDRLLDVDLGHGELLRLLLAHRARGLGPFITSLSEKNKECQSRIGPQIIWSGENIGPLCFTNPDTKSSQ